LINTTIDLQEATMKLPTETKFTTSGINTFTLLGISLTWGHMLDWISLWLLPLTILSIAIGYGSEVRQNNPDNIKL